MGAQEGRGRKKLRFGVRIRILDPKWDRSCAACLAYQWKNDGTIYRDLVSGEPERRDPNTETPCLECPKPPTWAKAAGKHESELRILAKPNDFTQENQKAYRFYQQCAATLRFPDDPIVSWYSGVIREIEEECRGVPHMQTAETVKILVKLILKDMKT